MVTGGRAGLGFLIDSHTQFPQEDAGLHSSRGGRVLPAPLPAEGEGFGHEVFEGGGGVHVVAGQGDPELDAVQHGGVWRGVFGVVDAVAGGHEVEFAGADVGDGAEGVAVFDGAGEDPAGGLQAGVGVRGDAHAAGDGDVVGAVVVDEAPGADHTAVAGGQQTADGHGAQPTQGHGAGLNEFHGFSVRRGGRGWVGMKVGASGR